MSSIIIHIQFFDFYSYLMVSGTLRYICIYESPSLLLFIVQRYLFNVISLFVWWSMSMEHWTWSLCELVSCLWYKWNFVLNLNYRPNRSVVWLMVRHRWNTNCSFFTWHRFCLCRLSILENDNATYLSRKKFWLLNCAQFVAHCL